MTDTSQLNDTLLSRAQELLQTEDTTETLNEALRVLVQLERQKGLLALGGKVDWEGDLDEMRQDRFDDGSC